LIPLLVLIDLHLVSAIGVALILARELTVAGWRVGQAQISGANIWGKLKTVSQIVAIAMMMVPVSLTASVFGTIDNWRLYSALSFWLAVALTLISGLIYFLPAPTQSQSSS
jgi:CDP-diacylglycerol---glycerol-3-phosphate 3-phosphatidyltransferase